MIVPVDRAADKGRKKEDVIEKVEIVQPDNFLLITFGDEMHHLEGRIGDADYENIIRNTSPIPYKFWEKDILNKCILKERQKSYD